MLSGVALLMLATGPCLTPTTDRTPKGLPQLCPDLPTHGRRARVARARIRFDGGVERNAIGTAGADEGLAVAKD